MTAGQAVFRAGDRIRYATDSRGHETGEIWSHGPQDGTWWIIPDRPQPPGPGLVQGCQLARTTRMQLIHRHTPDLAEPIGVAS